jgi:hypothetical protein
MRGKRIFKMAHFPIFEHRSQSLLPVRQFLLRVVKHVIVGLVFMFIALGIGVVGYHGLEGLSWLDSFLNASMILGGMGPVAELQNPAAKLFAGFYALFAGLAFIGVVGVIVLPIAHRLLHLLHLESK